VSDDRKINYVAPVLPLDYPAEGEVVHPCPDCLPWHLEVVTDPETGQTMIREWHAVGCPVFQDPDQKAEPGHDEPERA
jgi:hypothetical protein